MRTGTIQRILNDHYDRYSATRKVSNRERVAAWNIRTCRTPAQGCHIDECPNGHHRVILNNSCKHRSCPQCGATETELWIQRRMATALACPYYHVIFTIPHALHPLWRKNRRKFTNHLFHAAWYAIRDLMGDPKWLGAYPGAVAVFQSWGDELQEHCHLHMLVTAGGLGKRGRWRAARTDFLLPTRVLATLFRGKLLAYLREALDIRLPVARQLQPPTGWNRPSSIDMLYRLGRDPWHVQIEPAYNHPGGAFRYLGHYIRRGPLSENRVLDYDGQSVTVAYPHPDKQTGLSFRLPVEKFIQRYLQHVPEKGTHCARVYGLFHFNCRKQLEKARSQLGQSPCTPLPARNTHELLEHMFAGRATDRCPVCHAQLRTVHVYRPGRSPPGAHAA